MNQADPTLALQSIGDQLVRTTLSALRTGVGYEVRTEVVGEKGSGMIGLDVGLMRKTAPGYWGERITPSFKERFGRASDVEIQRRVNAVRAGGATGDYTDGPTAWDVYAAAAVCAAVVRSLETGETVAVDMVSRGLVTGAQV